MTAYNIVNAPSMVAGQPEDVSQVLANFQAIAAVLNGNLDNSNLAAAANIAISKLVGYPTDATKFLRGDGAWAAAGGVGSTTASITAANTDLPAPGVPNYTYVVYPSGGGSVRSIGAAPVAGSQFTFRAWADFQLLHSTAGGPGSTLFLPTGANMWLHNSESASFYWDGGSNWIMYNKWTTAGGNFGWIGSSPPTNPNPGDIWVFPADGAAEWMFIYDPAQATYKWRFIGGAPLSAVIDTEETTTSASYVDLATAGPTVTTPRAGDYRLTFGARCWTSTGTPKYMASPSIGGGAAADADSAGMLMGASDATMAHRVNRTNLLKTGLAASTAIKLQYRADTTGSTQHWLNRQIDILPVRVT